MESETKTVKAVTEYVAEVSRLAKTGKATEHTFRGALAALIDALAPGLKAVNEPKRTECGAPDYIVHDKTGLGVFYVEAKDLGDDDLDGKKRTGHKEQFDRYKAALDTIIFTDYLDFRLYRHGQFANSVRIADWDGEGKVSGRPAAYADFAALVADAAAGAPQKIDSAKRLAELMAGKARLLQRNAEEYLAPLSKAYDDAPDGAKPPLTPILELLLGLRGVLMPDVGADEFSDIFAQTLTYGMFAARLNDTTPETFSRYEAMALIPKTNPFLKQLFQYVANNLEDELEWMVDDLADLFRSADVAKIMRSYGRTGADPMIHFYEDFLAAYDAGLRKDRGVWYTPIQVVKFVVGAADWALRTRFGLPDGLADRSKVEIEREEIAPHGKRMARKVKKTVHRVQLLDPATGTGTFIAESIRQIFEKFKGNEGMWPGYVESDLLPRLNGFELLMASYTMAHIKIDMALRETGATPSGKERFRVFLTDSLSDWHKELPGGLFASALAPEQQGADEVKRDTPVMVVMGNPPYNVSSSNKSGWIQNLVADYKKNLNERNIQPLSDDYIKFVRLGHHYVEKNGEGILVYITNNSFLDGLIHREMRRRLLETFDEIYVLNLHGNSRKKETAPDGSKDENVFNIMQGVAITLFVKKGGVAAKNAKDANVYYADLWGKKKDKLAALDDATMESVKWQELQLAEPYYFFVPKDFALEDEYNRGFRIDELVGSFSLGIQSGRDELFYDASNSLLSERMQALFQKPLSAAMRNRFNIIDRSGFMLETHVQAAEFSEAKITEVLLRPFDLQYIYYDDKVLKRAFRKVMSHLLHENISLCIVKNSRNGLIGNYHVSVKLVGKDYVSPLDNCHVFPLYLYEENMGKMEKRANLDKDIVGKLRASASLREEPSPEDIFDYIYGVLHSPAYRAKFKEFLKVDFPRIPYPKDAAEFSRFRDAGRELRMTHLMKDAEPALSEMRARFPVAGDNTVDKVEWEDGRVYINATQYFDNVPVEAWEQPIGGYRPAEKWLKDRKGRVLTQDDLKHYQRIILALAKTREIMNGLMK